MIYEMHILNLLHFVVLRSTVHHTVHHIQKCLITTSSDKYVEYVKDYICAGGPIIEEVTA